MSQLLPQLLPKSKSVRLSLLALVVMLGLLAALNPTVALNDGGSEKHAAVGYLLRQSGISTQLEQLLPLVVEEMAAGRSDCISSESDERSLLVHMQQILEPAGLIEDAVGMLSARLSNEGVEVATEWYQSAAGTAISEAEMASGDLDATQFDALLESTTSSPLWTEQRRNSVKKILQLTRTPEFFTTYNTGVVTLTTLASTCERPAMPAADTEATDGPTVSMEDELQRRENLVKTYDWRDTFVATVVLGEIIPVTGAVFNQITNEHLTAYIEFADSKAGTELFLTMPDITEQLLKQRLDQVGEFFVK